MGLPLQCLLVALLVQASLAVPPYNPHTHIPPPEPCEPIPEPCEPPPPPPPPPPPHRPHHPIPLPEPLPCDVPPPPSPPPHPHYPHHPPPPPPPPPHYPHHPQHPLPPVDEPCEPLPPTPPPHYPHYPQHPLPPVDEPCEPLPPPPTPHYPHYPQHPLPPVVEPYEPLPLPPSPHYPHYPQHPLPPVEEPNYPYYPQHPSPSPPPPPHYPHHPNYPPPPPQPEPCELPAPPPPPSPPPIPPFPETFSFGVGNGAYHIEGAWNQDGKIETIWDSLTHTNPGFIVDKSNPDWSADAYNKLEQDVEILNNLTVTHYKFSIAWSRIFTCDGEINQLGVDHYLRLFTLLKENSIEPIVTIYDSDLPQYIQDKGGFLCDQFADWYLTYAKTLFELFGCQVKYWITFDSPNQICVKGYGDGTFAPGISKTGYNEYICAYNLLRAHAAAYHLYDDSYRPTQKGKISLAIDSAWYQPKSDCEEDVRAAELKRQFTVGLWAHPLYEGNFPEAVIKRINYLSKLQGCSPRLPQFTKHEIAYIKDTHDFFSLNFGKSVFVNAIVGEECLTPSYYNDVGAELTLITGIETAFGIRKLIGWIKDQYQNPSVFITGDGWNTYDRNCQDWDRKLYIREVLMHIRLAILKDDARVYAYTYSSYIDGWQDVYGYTEKWGLYDVEFDCPEKTRTARLSAEYYQFVAKTHCIDEPCYPSHHY